MRKDFSGRQVVKLEHVLYKILLIFIYRPGFTTCFNHHTYIFFANMCL